jgi:hypothetical protein
MFTNEENVKMREMNDLRKELHSYKEKERLRDEQLQNTQQLIENNNLRVKLYDYVDNKGDIQKVVKTLYGVDFELYYTNTSFRLDGFRGWQKDLISWEQL